MYFPPFSFSYVELRSKDINLVDVDPLIINRIKEFCNYFQEHNLMGKKFKLNDKLTADLLK